MEEHDLDLAQVHNLLSYDEDVIGMYKTLATRNGPSVSYLWMFEHLAGNVLKKGMEMTEVIKTRVTENVLNDLIDMSLGKGEFSGQ